MQKERSRLEFKKIGSIHTPYKNTAPYQPEPDDDGEFYIRLEQEYTGGLKDLEKFKYIYVIYYIDRLKGGFSMDVSPPWIRNRKVGLFASRSPSRPNPIGLSIVRIIKIHGNIIKISGMDAFDGTPLLDIKPYIKELDSKPDANYGWLDNAEDKDHLLLHIKGIPH